MITIINYGMGNLGSVQNMFKKIGVESQITSDIEVIEKAGKILLPGVRAFDAAIESIDKVGFREVLNRKALQEKVPVLGICLGMQLLTDSSEEGKLPGLGWIPAKTIRFDFEKDSKLKVPHMELEPGISEKRQSANTGFASRTQVLFRSFLLCKS